MAGDGRVVLSWRSGEYDGVSFIFHLSYERLRDVGANRWDVWACMEWSVRIEAQRGGKRAGREEEMMDLM